MGTELGMSLIEKVLSELELTTQLSIFTENDIDDDTFIELDNDDLKELGFSLGHRKKLIKAIAQHDASNSSPIETTESLISQPVALTDKDLDGERRHLTIVFCDLVGSTALSERHDAEDLRTILSSYHETVAKEVTKLGGHIAKFMGDGAMIYFGYPIAHENDAERAIRFGIAMRNAVTQLDLNIGEKLNTRVGIASGHVVIGHLIGGGISQEHTVTGETPNLAARLEGAAGVNEIIIADNTRQLIGDFFELTQLDPMTLKGFREPVTTWKVLNEKTITNRFKALRGEHTGVMHGRDDELLLLKMGWKKANSGIGQSYIIFGEAGIGKSHLVESLLNEVESDNALVVHLYCSPHHPDSALYPVVQFFTQILQRSGEENSKTPLTILENHLTDLSFYSDERLALLSSLLNIDCSSKVEDLSYTPGVQKEKTLTLIGDYLATLSVQKPLLVITEDLHWIDPTTDNLLGSISEMVESAAIMLVCTSRPSFQPSWHTYPASVTTLALQRLPASFVSDIINGVTQGKSLPAALVKQIADKSDGIPIFIEELTRSVLNMDVLEDRDGKYVMTKSMEDIGVPTTLHDALISRLENSPEIKQTAQVGAVIGRDFNPDLHAAVTQMNEAETQTALAELMETGILAKKVTQYIFKHALVQDAIYQSLLKNQRQLYHGRIADILERDFEELAIREPEIFALHNEHAGRFEKAHHYLMQAGGLAMSKAAVLEALNYYERALELINKHKDSPDVRSKEVKTLLAKAQATLVVVGPGSPELAKIIEQASVLCEELGPSTELFGVFLFSSFVGLVRANYIDANKFADLAYENSPAKEPLMVIKGLLKGGAAFFQGDLNAAMQYFEDVTNQYNFEQHKGLAKVFDGTDPSQAPLSWGSIALWMKGKICEADKRYDDALNHAHAIDHKPNTATAWGWASFHSVVRLDAERALHAGEKTKQLGVELGFPFREAEGLIAHGWATARLEDPKKGIEELSLGIEQWRATGGEVGRPLWLSLLADAHVLDNDPESALTVMDEAFNLIEQTNERLWFAELFRRKAKVLTHTGQNQEAIELLQTAIEEAVRYNFPMIELLSRADLVRLGNSMVNRPAHWLSDLKTCFDSFANECHASELEECRQLLSESPINN